MKLTFFDWEIEHWKAFFCALDSMAELGVLDTPEERAVLVTRHLSREMPDEFVGEPCK